MSIPVIAFFNNKGGVGKTTLVYHLSWAFSDLGTKILAADLDPQANLTAFFLDENELGELWSENSPKRTVYRYIESLMHGIDDPVYNPYTVEVSPQLHLLPGELSLSLLEDDLFQQWLLCLEGKERAFRIISAFSHILQFSAQKVNAELILLDLGPNLGAINRSSLMATNYLLIPLTPDMYSLQGLKIIGQTIRKWRKDWVDHRDKNPTKILKVPFGDIEPLGYVVMQHLGRADHLVKMHERWISRIPKVYQEEVLGRQTDTSPLTPKPSDYNCLGLVKHYRSLIPMSMDAHKPIFHLLPADGAIGSHYHAVHEAEKNFKQLAKEIEKRYKEREVFSNI
jgi:chromosome partitioning protein